MRLQLGFLRRRQFAGRLQLCPLGLDHRQRGVGFQALGARDQLCQLDFEPLHFEQRRDRAALVAPRPGDIQDRPLLLDGQTYSRLLKRNLRLLDRRVALDRRRLVVQRVAIQGAGLSLGDLRRGELTADIDSRRLLFRQRRQRRLRRHIGRCQLADARAAVAVRLRHLFRFGRGDGGRLRVPGGGVGLGASLIDQRFQRIDLLLLGFGRLATRRHLGTDAGQMPLGQRQVGTALLGEGACRVALCPRRLLPCQQLLALGAQRPGQIRGRLGFRLARLGAFLGARDQLRARLLKRAVGDIQTGDGRAGVGRRCAKLSGGRRRAGGRSRGLECRFLSLAE